MPLVWVLRPTAGSLFLAALSKCLTDPCAGCLARRGAPESRLSAACPKQKAASAPREPRAPRPPAAMSKARAAAERWLWVCDPHD